MPTRDVTFTGIHFDNPFLLSSAPPTESENNILRAFEAGWGGVVTKTIGLHPVVNVVGAKAKFMRTSPEDAYVSMKKRPGAALHCHALASLLVEIGDDDGGAGRRKLASAGRAQTRRAAAHQKHAVFETHRHILTRKGAR